MQKPITGTMCPGPLSNFRPAGRQCTREQGRSTAIAVCGGDNSYAASSTEGPEWLYELKLDGYRALDAAKCGLEPEAGNVTENESARPPQRRTVHVLISRRDLEFRGVRRAAGKP